MFTLLLKRTGKNAVLGVLEYKVSFSIDWVYIVVSNKTVEAKRMTCTIEKKHVTKSDPIVTGQTICGPSDTFDFSVGRKISLARALKKAGFPREMRKRFWDAYFLVEDNLIR